MDAKCGSTPQPKQSSSRAPTTSPPRKATTHATDSATPDQRRAPMRSTGHDHTHHVSCPACHVAECRRIAILDGVLISAILAFTVVILTHWITS